MKKLIACLSLVSSIQLFALNGVYLGAQGGYVSFSTPPYQSGLGAGVDLGLGVGPVMDVVLSGQWSSHSGGAGLTLNSYAAAANFHFGNFYDVDMSVGFGPGLYRFGSNSRFGLHGDLNADVVLDAGFRMGLGYRVNGIFGSAVSEGSYWSVMARFGYVFEM